jgi:SH3-like domain-containing protein
VSIRRGARNINIRANPSSSSAVVGKLSGGDPAEKIAEQDGWVRLRFQATGKASEGWVRRDLLEP